MNIKWICSKCGSYNDVVDYITFNGKSGWSFVVTKEMENDAASSAKSDLIDKLRRLMSGYTPNVKLEKCSCSKCGNRESWTKRLIPWFDICFYTIAIFVVVGNYLFHDSLIGWEIGLLFLLLFIIWIISPYIRFIILKHQLKRIPPSSVPEVIILDASDRQKSLQEARR